MAKLEDYLKKLKDVDELVKDGNGHTPTEKSADIYGSTDLSPQMSQRTLADYATRKNALGNGMLNPHGNAISEDETGIRYPDGYFVYKDDDGYYTEWGGVKTRTNRFGSPLQTKTGNADKSADDSNGTGNADKSADDSNGTGNADKKSDEAMESGPVVEPPTATVQEYLAGEKSADEIYDELLQGAYYRNAVAQAQKTAEDVLGKYAGTNGGQISSWGLSAAASAESGVKTDAQNYLWQLAQSKYADNKNDAEAEAQRYSDMIGQAISMGYSIDEIPDEWFARSAYDRNMAQMQAGYVAKSNAETPAATPAETITPTQANTMLSNLIKQGYTIDEIKTQYPDLLPASQYAEDYYRRLGGDTVTPSDTSMFEGARAAFANGAEALADFIAENNISDEDAELIYNYLETGNLPAKYRKWKVVGDTKNHGGGIDRNDIVEDENGNKMKVVDLRKLLMKEGMSKAEANTFIENNGLNGEK